MYIKFTFLTDASGLTKLEKVDLTAGSLPRKLTENTITTHDIFHYFYIQIPGPDTEVTVKKIYSDLFLKNYLSKDPVSDDKLELLLKQKLATFLQSEAKEIKSQPFYHFDIAPIKQIYREKIGNAQDICEAAKHAKEYLRQPEVFKQTHAVDELTLKFIELLIKDDFKYGHSKTPPSRLWHDKLCAESPGKYQFEEIFQYLTLMFIFVDLANGSNLYRDNILILQENREFIQNISPRLNALIDEKIAPKKSPATPLAIAAGKGDLAEVKRLLDDKADANSALHSAVSSDEIKRETNRHEIIKLLIKHNADLEKKENQFTPLMHAVSPSVAEFLEKQGANRNVLLDLITSLFKVDESLCSKEDRRIIELANYLIETNRDNKYYTEIYFSASSGSTASITKKILSLNVDMDRTPAQILERAFISPHILAKEAVLSLLPKYQGPDALNPRSTIPQFLDFLCRRDFAGFTPVKVILYRDVFLRILKAISQHSLFDLEAVKYTLNEGQVGMTKGAISAALIATQQGQLPTFVVVNLPDQAAKWHQQYTLAISTLKLIQSGKLDPSKIHDMDLQNVNVFLTQMVAAGDLKQSVMTGVSDKNYFKRGAACKTILAKLGVENITVNIADMKESLAEKDPKLESKGEVRVPPAPVASSQQESVSLVRRMR